MKTARIITFLPLEYSFRFKFGGNVDNLKLVVSNGDFIEKGKPILSGERSNIEFWINLRDFFGDKFQTGTNLKVMDGEIVSEGTILAEGMIDGFAVKRIKAPTGGVVRINGDILELHKGNAYYEEIARISGTFRGVDGDKYGISAPAMAFKYSFLLGKSSKISSWKLVVIDIENPDSILVKMPDDIEKGSVAVVKMGVIPRLYRDACERGLSGIICGGLCFSDYLEIKKQYPDMPVWIVVMNSWGNRVMADAVYDRIALQNGTSGICDKSSNSVILHNRANSTIDTSVSGVSLIEVGSRVVLNDFKNYGKMAIVDKILDGENLVVQLDSTKQVAINYRLVQLIKES